MYAQVVLGPLEALKAKQKSKIAIETELRVALVGKTGVGKSATGNTICGEKFFKSGLHACSVTQICQQRKTSVIGRDILIIDTPGIFDTETEPTVVENEIKRCVHIGAPGLHAVLFIMEIGRFRQEDDNAITTFLRFFESEMKDRVIVVFTFGDRLLKENIKLNEHLEGVPKNLKTFLENCENRCILFNNEFNKQESYEQINGLLTMIEALKRSNELAYYSDALFMKAEERIQVREKEIEEKVKREFEEKQHELLRRMKIQMEKQMQEDRKEELQQAKQDYEKKLANVREEVRQEIADTNSSCTIL